VENAQPRLVCEGAEFRIRPVFPHFFHS
jgi:hypothetical protein